MGALICTTLGNIIKGRIFLFMILSLVGETGSSDIKNVGTGFEFKVINSGRHSEMVSFDVILIALLPTSCLYPYP